MKVGPLFKTSCVQGAPALNESWELWADSREIERRKVERRKARLPPEERRRQIAEEWSRAKHAAAAAKKVSDKAQQKSLGLMIRDLKLEMATIGTICNPGQQHHICRLPFHGILLSAS